MPQTSYSLSVSPAYEGGKGDSADCVIQAGINKDVVEIPFGRMVCLGGSLSSLGVNDCITAIMPVDATSEAIGVAMHSHAHDPNNTSGVPVGDMFNVLKSGVVYVQVEQAVSPGDAVFYRHTLAGATGTSPALGRFRKDADTAKATEVINARWLGTAAAGAIVALELNASLLA